MQPFEPHDPPRTVLGADPDTPVEHLWRRWVREQCPDFAAAAGGPSVEQALAVLRFDQCERWRAGDRVPAEKYLRGYSVLRSDPEAALLLIYGEYLLRQELGEAPSLEEYLRRFPEHADQLREQDEFSQVLKRLAGLDTLTPPEAAAPAAAARPSVAGYEILEELGRGGMGVVYKARQQSLNRLVALKVIRAGAQADPEGLARFRREAEAVARLQHPHVVQIYEIGEREGQPFLALEFLEGGSLERRVNGTPQPAREAARLVETLARAAHAAHQRGVVHRDLKPANVLLTADGQPKITDFGLARRLDQDTRHTASGAVLGTPSYMAPEQAAGKPGETGPAVDVYALGAILYECLTGRPPFRGATVLDTLEQVRSREPVSPTRLQPHVPRDLETVCLKCLDKEPARRYASAGELADDLRRFLDGEPILARRVGPAERLWRWCRRGRVRAALTAALVLALGVGAVLGVHAARHRRRAEEYGRHVRELDEQRLRLVREIDATRLALQAKLDEQKRRHEAAGNDPDEPAEEAPPAPAGPEVRALAGRLKELLDQLPSEAAEAGADLPLRLAEATVANAERRFDKALAIVTGEDLQAERERSEALREREVKVNRVRGDAQYGLRRWADALACYRRIAQLQPDDWENRLRVADCLSQLKRPEDVLAEYGKLIDELTRLVEKEGHAGLAAELATALNRRGSLRTRQGKYSEAVPDLDKAVALRTRLVEKEGRTGLVADLATSLTNRGIALRGLNRPADAVADLDEAVTIRTRLIEKEGHEGLAADLATSLTNRGAALLSLDKAKEALPDLDKAVALRTKLVEQGSKWVANDLATSLAYRGGAWRALGKLAEAFADHDRVVQIRIRLVEKEGRKDLANELAWGLSSRGGVLREQGKLPEALADLTKAVALRRRLIEHEGRQDLEYAHTGSLIGRGLVLRDMGRLTAALADLNQAVQVRARLVEKEGRKGLAGAVAHALDGRAAVYLDQGRLPEAVADYDRAVTIFTRLVEKEGRQELAGALAAIQKRRDRAKAAAGAVEDLDATLKLPQAQAGELLMFRARALAAQGKPAGAAETGDKLHELNPKAPYFLYRAARCYALAAAAVAAGKKDLSAEDQAEQRRHADKAMDLLRQALGRGFKDFNRLRYEPDLDPLRRREDFKKLFTEVAEKGQ